MLTRLCYASQIAPDCGEAEFGAIVDHACSVNPKLGITGVIAFDGRKIIQILEGPANAVDTLYDKIRRDPRHQGVVELSRTEIERPSFAEWGMTRRPVAEVYLMSETG